MDKCSWCGEETEKVKVVKDSYSKLYKVCPKCAKKSKSHKCIKCGVTSNIIMQGYCPNCYQLKVMSSQMQSAGINSIAGDMSEEQFEKWITSGKSMSLEEINKNPELKKMWVILKLQLAGIKENKDVQNYFGKAIKMVDRSTEKLMGVKCKFIISNNGAGIDKANIIDSEEDLYIVHI